MDFYHVYNRGVEGRTIFNDKTDLNRFNFTLKAFNNNLPIGGIYQMNLNKNLDIGCLNNSKPLVSIVAYCLNPTHYHLLLGVMDLSDLGNYLRRINGGYTKFFNHRHERSGVLFQGKTKKKLILNNQYLNYVASYVLGNKQVHGIKSNQLSLTSFESGVKDEFGFNTLSFVKKAEALGKNIFLGRREVQGYEIENLRHRMSK